MPLSPTHSASSDSIRLIGPNANSQRCAQDEKRELYNRLDPSGGGAGICCADLACFVEGPAADYGGGAAAAAASDAVFAVSAALAVKDEQDGVGKLLRRAQATIVEAAQVLLFFIYFPGFG